MAASILILDVSILFNITNYIKIMLSSDYKSNAPKVGSVNTNIDFGTSGTTHKTIQYDSFQLRDGHLFFSEFPYVLSALNYVFCTTC